jgi:hypothetical protein
MSNEIRLDGILSQAAANRLNRPELVGAEVEYTPPIPPRTNAGWVYLRSTGERIGGNVSIGEGGILPPWAGLTFGADELR